MKVYLIENEDGSVMKACSTLEKVKEYCDAHSYKEANCLVEFEVDGEEWGTIIGFEELDEYTKGE